MMVCRLNIVDIPPLGANAFSHTILKLTALIVMIFGTLVKGRVDSVDHVRSLIVRFVRSISGMCSPQDVVFSSIGRRPSRR
eukprot:3796509-Ditylum_brightwellii.AAC.1